MSPFPDSGRVMAARDIESVVRRITANRFGIRAADEIGTLPAPVSDTVVPSWSRQLFSAARDQTSGIGRDHCILELGVISEHYGYCRTRVY